MKRLFVETYGCQMNARDSEEVAGLLLSRGYRLTRQERQADVILYNTCSVREHAEDRVWSNVGRLKELKRDRPEVVIGVLGCMAKAQRGKIFRRMPHVDFISGPAQLYQVPVIVEEIRRQRLVRRIGQAGGGCETVVASAPAGPRGGAGRISAITEKRRAQFKHVPYHANRVTAFVTVMEGCDKVCSYCVIPYTRGPEISRPAESVLEEVRSLAEDGVKEVTLLGQNVNSYGRRLPGERTGVVAAGENKGTVPFGDSPCSFAGLLAQVNAVPGIERIRFTTSHPWDAVEELFLAMRDLEHVCEHLHLPVQSGSDRVLDRMRRGYTAERYLATLEALRAAVPEVAVTTDLIVGFPGETEEDFEATCRLVERARFDSAFMFKYSPRPYAAASRWKDDVPEAVKDERLQRLLALQERISGELDQEHLGRVEEVLVEERKDGLCMGRTRTHKKVYFPASEPSQRGRALLHPSRGLPGAKEPDPAAEGHGPGDLVRIRVERIRGHSLVGKPAA